MKVVFSGNKLTGTKTEKMTRIVGRYSILLHDWLRDKRELLYVC